MKKLNGLIAGGSAYDKLLKTVAFSVALAIGACGGSGGSSPPPSPAPQPLPPVGNPPPPVNTPPTFVVLAPAESVFEGRPIEVQVRDTRDADGDTVQFNVNQASGPAAQLITTSTGEEPSYFFEAPEVAISGGTETVSFEVTGSDGVNPTVAQTVTVTVRDNDQPGLPIAVIESDDRLFAEVFSRFNNRTNTRGLTWLSPNGLQADILNLALGVDDSFGSYGRILGTIQYHPNDVVLFDPLPFRGISVRNRDDYIVLSQDRDALEWYTSVDVFDSDNDFVGTRLNLQQSEPFTDPCAVAETQNTGDDFVWVGTRNGGVFVTEVRVIVDQDGFSESFVQNRLQTIGAGRSPCLLFPTSLADSYYPTNNRNSIPGLISIDVLNRDIFVIADTDADGTWEEVDVIPLDLSGNANLRVVDVLSIGAPARVPRFIAVLVSDGLDGGDHRLIVVAQDENDQEIYQETYQWSGGAPIKLLYGAFAGGPDTNLDPVGSLDLQDMAVISASSTGNVVLRRLAGGSSSSVPVYAPPVPFPFMEGASNGITSGFRIFNAEPENYARYGVIATFPADRSIRFFGLAVE